MWAFSTRVLTMHKHTLEVANEEKKSVSRIRYLIEHGHLPKPPVDFAGNYVWDEQHVARLREVDARLRARRPRQQPVAQAEGPVVAA
jgi:hypothetical protein